MRLPLLWAVAVVIAGVAALVLSVVGRAQTTTAKSGSTAKTSWGEPDLQGLWSDEYQTPLQRPPQYAGKGSLRIKNSPIWIKHGRPSLRTRAAQ
jgi:hypothetical protein